MSCDINTEITTKLHYKDIALIAAACGLYQEAYKDTADKEVLQRMKSLVDRLGVELYDFKILPFHPVTEAKEALQPGKSTDVEPLTEEVIKGWYIKSKYFTGDLKNVGPILDFQRYLFGVPKEPKGYNPIDDSRLDPYSPHAKWINPMDVFNAKQTKPNQAGKAKESEKSCDNCKYEKIRFFKEPCIHCKFNYSGREDGDYFKPKSEPKG